MRSRNSHSATNTASPPPSTQRLCGKSVAPRISIGRSPEKAGNWWNCLSKTIWATPRMNIDAPMVMMIKVTGEAPRAGSMARRCRSSPTITAVRMAMMAASGSGTPVA